MPFAGVVVTALKLLPPTTPEITQAVTEVEPPPVEPAGVTEIVDVAAPAGPIGNVTVVNAAFGAGAYVSVGGTAANAGQVMVDINAGNAAAAGVSVCVQLSVAVAAAAWGVQLKPMAGAFAPKVAGASIVRFAPVVIANAAAPGWIVQASATLAFATPAVATLTAAVPVPAVSVTATGNALSVGATGVTEPAGQVKPQTRDAGAPAVSVQVKVAVPAVAARVQPKLTVPAVVT